MKLFIPITDNGSGQVRSEFVISFFAAFTAKIGREVKLAHFSDSHPDRNRNRAAASFLASDCDYIFFIDGDIIFTAKHLEMMDADDSPILAGMYFLKNPDEAKPCLQTLPDFQRTATGGVIPVARVGTGFLRVHRSVFEAMKPMVKSYVNHGRIEWDFFSSGVIDGQEGLGEWISEDWGFCDRAREAGFTINLHTGIQLGHVGGITYPIVKKVPHLQLIPQHFGEHIDSIFAGEYAIPGIQPKTILDIGANIGGFTAWAKETWPDARVIAYEPHPHNAALWHWNTAEFSHVDLVEAAVTTEPGPVNLTEGQNCGEHSTKMAGPNWVSVGTVHPSMLPAADFVKIDTEGCEVEILTHLDLSKAQAVALEYHTAEDREKIEAMLGVNFEIISSIEATPRRGVLKFKRREAANAIAA